jgi:hypothetical protein
MLKKLNRKLSGVRRFLFFMILSVIAAMAVSLPITLYIGGLFSVFLSFVIGTAFGILGQAISYHTLPEGVEY